MILQEIKFGDNDTLSAITAAMVQADYLFLMTDVDCLYDKNPRTHPDAQAIEVVEDISSLAADVSTAGSSLGTGGMSTKIVAARLATSAGVTTVITRSSEPGNIVNIINHVQALRQSQQEAGSLTPTSAMEEAALSRSTASVDLDALFLKPPLHTRFLPDLHPIRDRSFWLLHGLAPHGIIYIDEGAHRALADKAGLLPVGVVDVEGQFSQQEAVRIVVVQRLPHLASTSKKPSLSQATVTTIDSTSNRSSSSDAYEKANPAPFEVGRALVNYSATEIARIKGLRSTEIQGVLGYADSEYVALRENISLLKPGRSSRPVTPSLAEIPASQGPACILLST